MKTNKSSNDVYIKKTFVIFFKNCLAFFNMDIILFLYIILHINNFWTNPYNTKKDSQPFYTQLKKIILKTF